MRGRTPASASQMSPEVPSDSTADAEVAEHSLRVHVARRSLWLRSSSAACQGRIANMDENRISGSTRNASGKAEEAVGRVTGDLKKQVQGKLDQAAGAAQEFYGQTADAARDTAVTLDKWLRSTIET